MCHDYLSPPMARRRCTILSLYIYVCVYIFLVYVCMCIYIYSVLLVFTVFYSLSITNSSPFTDVKRENVYVVYFLFYLFSLFRKGYEFIFTRTTCRFLIDVFLVPRDIHKIQDNLCVTLLPMSCSLVDVR